MFKLAVSSTVALLALLGPMEGAHAQLVGANSAGSTGTSQIFEINPANGALSNFHTITLPGYTVYGALCLAVKPGTRTLYAVIQTGSANNVKLCTIDHTTGIATLVAPFEPLGVSSIWSIAFVEDGTPSGATLYGASNGYATPRNTLFSVDLTTAAATPLFAMGNREGYDIIAAHPSGLIYRLVAGRFYSVNPATQAVTQIATGFTPCTAMTWHSGLDQLLAVDEQQRFFRIDPATGGRTNLGDMSSQLGIFYVCRSLAYLPPAPPPPACGPADLGSAGGAGGSDGHLDNNDFIAFINLFFAHGAGADVGVTGGASGSDGLYDNNDFIAFINSFFNAPAGCQG